MTKSRLSVFSVKTVSPGTFLQQLEAFFIRVLLIN